MSQEDAAPARPRGRGWALPVLLALTAAAVAVVPPAPLIFVPFGLMALGLAPRRPAVVVGGLALASLAFAGGGDGALWFAEQGWALILGAWFVSATVLLPEGGFLVRALMALAGALGSAALLLAPLADGFTRLDQQVRDRLHGAAVEVTVAWNSADFGEFGGAMSSAAIRAAEMQSQLYPALLSLGSLAALAVAYWGWARLARREAAPLGGFRSFGFPDGLVWVLIAALLLVVALDGAWERAGWNGALFMGVLYALRGAAVLGTIVPRPGIAGRILMTLMIVVLYPVALGTALMVGLTDTWIDLRARHAQAESEG